MDIKYSLKNDEYIDFNIKYILNSKIIRKFFYIQKVSLAVAFSGILYLFYKTYKPSILFIMSIFCLVYIGGSVLEAFIISYLLKRKLKENIVNDKRILGDKNLRFLDDGIHEISENSDYLVKWKYVRNLEVVEEYIFITTDLNKGYIIPKKDIENIDELVDKVNKHKRKKGGNNELRED